MEKVAANDFLSAKNVPKRQKNKLFGKPLIDKGFLFIPFWRVQQVGF